MSIDLATRMTRTPRLRAAARALVWVALVWLPFAVADCSRAGGQLTELQKARSGSLDVVLLSPHEALRHGKDTFAIEFRAASDGRLVDVGDVRASATMPMPGMPMFGSIDVKRTDVAGRYTADGQFDMAGTWRMSIQWKGPSGEGSVTFAGTVSLLRNPAPRLEARRSPPSFGAWSERQAC